jgi:hypothetical protein
MTNIYGTIGCSLLKKKINKDFIYVLLFADMHSILPYCDNKIDINKWLENNINKVNILLEEVPRSNNFSLNELWTNSEHTQKLKYFFLNNTNLIHAIDIRPYLILFSLDLCDMSSEPITLQNYLKSIDEFFIFENSYIKSKLKNVYSINYLNNNIELKNHFEELKQNFLLYKKKNNIFMNVNICDIFKNNIQIKDSLNNILDSIMEWYTIANIFELKYNKKNVIIHTGLYHSNNIQDKLIKLYNYTIEYSNGVTTLDSLDNSKLSGCVVLPVDIQNKLSIINK